MVIESTLETAEQDTEAVSSVGSYIMKRENLITIPIYMLQLLRYTDTTLRVKFGCLTTHSFLLR